MSSVTADFMDTDNLAIDTTPLAVPCKEIKIIENSYQWLIAGYSEFDKLPGNAEKSNIVMRSNKQFGGTFSGSLSGSYGTGLFDEQIYCPNRKEFSSGATEDTYYKTICGSTKDCGWNNCGWTDEQAKVTNYYSVQGTDILTLTLTSTQTFADEPCLSAVIPGSSYGSNCTISGNTITCVIYGDDIMYLCPGWPQVNCELPITMQTNGTCSMKPRWFKNVKDVYQATTPTLTTFDITPLPENQYAGQWIVNGNQFLVPYITSRTGYDMTCFVNNKNISETAIFVDVVAAQSCDSTVNNPDKCFTNFLNLTNMYIGDVLPLGQKMFSFTATSLVPYVRNIGNTGEQSDPSKTFTLVGNGITSNDRYAALVTVCNKDQYVGARQGTTSAGWDNYTNDWPGKQNLGDTTSNTSISCIQKDKTTGGGRTAPVLTPLGEIWKN